jgi:hypothetical protein
LLSSRITETKEISKQLRPKCSKQKENSLHVAYHPKGENLQTANQKPCLDSRGADLAPEAATTQKIVERQGSKYSKGTPDARYFNT